MQMAPVNSTAKRAVAAIRRNVARRAGLALAAKAL
jgi:hypothetical protein